MGGIDGIMFIFPDFIEGLKRFDEQVVASDAGTSNEVPVEPIEKPD